MKPQGLIAEPQFGDEGHVPTLERVVQKNHVGVRFHVRVQRPQLLDRIRGLSAKIRHGNLDELASQVVVLLCPKIETGAEDGGEQPRVSGTAEDGLLRQESDRKSTRLKS